MKVMIVQYWGSSTDNGNITWLDHTDESIMCEDFASPREYNSIKWLDHTDERIM
jgi:hypothetical protein